MEAVQEDQDGRFKFYKRKKSSWLVETPEEKVKKGVKKKNMIDTPCESNINTVAEEHFSLENN